MIVAYFGTGHAMRVIAKTFIIIIIALLGFFVLFQSDDTSSPHIAFQNVANQDNHQQRQSLLQSKVYDAAHALSRTGNPKPSIFKKFAQDDEGIVEYVKQNFLMPPSPQPYNLESDKVSLTLVRIVR